MSEKAVTIHLTKHELVTLSNAISESLEALEEWEFATRMGASIEETKQLQKKVRALLRSISKG